MDCLLIFGFNNKIMTSRLIHLKVTSQTFKFRSSVSCVYVINFIGVVQNYAPINECISILTKFIILLSAIKCISTRHKHMKD